MRRWALAALLALAVLAAGYFVLAPRGSPPGDLIGRTWHLRSVVQDGPAIDLPQDYDPTLRLASDGQMHERYWCNDGLALYRIDGSDLVLRSMGITFAGCPWADLEDFVYGTLADRVHWEVRGSTLTLTRDGVVLTYVDRNQR